MQCTILLLAGFFSIPIAGKIRPQIAQVCGGPARIGLTPSLFRTSKKLYGVASKIWQGRTQLKCALYPERNRLRVLVMVTFFESLDGDGHEKIALFGYRVQFASRGTRFSDGPWDTEDGAGLCASSATTAHLEQLLHWRRGRWALGEQKMDR
jgi:hypothetical protein